MSAERINFCFLGSRIIVRPLLDDAKIDDGRNILLDYESDRKRSAIGRLVIKNGICAYYYY